MGSKIWLEASFPRTASPLPDCVIIHGVDIFYEWRNYVGGEMIWAVGTSAINVYSTTLPAFIPCGTPTR